MNAADGCAAPPPPPARTGLIAAALIAVLLIAAGVVVVLGTLERAVPGQATAAPAPDRPEAGDCLLDDPLGLDDDEYFSADGPLPTLRTARCDGTRYGEVVSVGAGTGRQSSAGDVAEQRCWSAAHGYLGVPDPATTYLERVPVADVWSVVIGPDARQRAAGQDWSACVVHLPPTGTYRAMTADHSLRGAWERPADGHLFSMCLDDESAQSPVPCEWTHAAEHVSYWSGDPGAPQESGLADCRADAIDALGSSVALDRGDLAVTVGYSRYADSDEGELIIGPEAVTADGDYFVDCMLIAGQAGRQLIGPLRGLGDAPVPLR